MAFLDGVAPLAPLCRLPHPQAGLPPWTCICRTLRLSHLGSSLAQTPLPTWVPTAYNPVSMETVHPPPPKDLLGKRLLLSRPQPADTWVRGAQRAASTTTGKSPPTAHPTPPPQSEWFGVGVQDGDPGTPTASLLSPQGPTSTVRQLPAPPAADTSLSLEGVFSLRSQKLSLGSGP